MRIDIELPERFDFATELPVLIGHINAGRHLANESLVALLNEARVRFLASRDIREGGVDGGVLVNANLMVDYRAEVRHGERLCIELAVVDRHRAGFDLVYRVGASGGDGEESREAARARTSHILIDAESRRARSLSPALSARLEASPSVT